MKHFPRKILFITCSLITSQAPFAAGLSISEISVMGVGTNNALVANYEDLGAVAYNPAATAFHTGMSVSNGLLLIAPDISVTTRDLPAATSSTHDGTGANVIGIPQFQATYTFNQQWSAGFGVTAPMGVESDWSYSDPFPALTLPLSAPSPATHPRKSKLEILQFSPTVAYKINPNTAISVGIDYYWLKDVDLNNDFVKIHGTGKEMGWNLSALHKQGDWSFGINYHSETEIDIDGEAVSAFGTSNANTQFTVPWRLQVGARYKLTPNLAIEGDVTRTGWNSYKEINITNSIGFPVPNPINLQNNWENSNSYRLGGTYQIQDKTQLRFGYSYDKTPKTMPDFSPTTPDADRHAISLGIAQEIGHGLALEAGYMHLFFKDRDVNNGAGVDGLYELSVDLLAIGLSKTF